MADFEDIVSAEFAHLKTLYFNTAYFGPSPFRSKVKVESFLARQLDPSFYEYDEWRDTADDIREKIARVLKCPSDCIAHGTSVSDFNNLIAQGYPFKKDDLVCAIDKEYPSNILPWMLAEKRNILKFKLLDLQEPYPTVEWLDQNLPDNTKVFVVSYVSFETGKAIDVSAIGEYLQQRNIFFILDATQALGGIGIKKSELLLVDILLCSSYKWMLGPYGHAFAYFSPQAQGLVEYTNATWTKSPNSQRADSLLDYTIETLPGARKYDRGQVANMLPLSSLDGSLDLINELGLDRIEEHNKNIRNYFLDNVSFKKIKLITPRDAMANILCFYVPGVDSLLLAKKLKEINIDISVREGNIRLSFHLFNTKDQIDKLLEFIN